jgi:GT2 family glycosyltransferase
MNKYTVVVNTYPHDQRDSDLLRCLQSLTKQHLQDFTVLLIENAHDDAAVKKIATDAGLTNFKIICNTTNKLSFLFNLGYKNSTTDLIAFLADDAEASTRWLEKIDEELQTNADTGVVTGPIISTIQPAGEMHRLYLLSQKNKFLQMLSWPYMHFVMEDKPLAPGNLFASGAYSLGAGLDISTTYPRQEIDLATTSSMGIRKACLDDVNGFDENYWFNHADGDLFIRIKKAGWKIIFDPQVIAHHHVRIGPSRNAFFIGRDTGLFYKKNVRVKDLHSFIGAFLNLLVYTGYWLYKFIVTGRQDQLYGITGFLKEFFS